MKAARSSTTSPCRSQATPQFLEARHRHGRGKLIPGCSRCPFGHLGDGNIHYNVSQPVGGDKADLPGALGRR
jgi:hypothetical protein